MGVESPPAVRPRLLLALVGCALGALLVALTPSASAQVQPTAAGEEADSTARVAPRIRAVRLAPEARIRIDGRLDEDEWAEAPLASGFVQYLPDAGTASGERTDARVLYDRSAIYVGVRCYVRDPATIVRRLSRRDPANPSDDVFVEIGSPADRRTAFSFGVNAAGVQQDGVISDDRIDSDPTWDAVWESGVETFEDATGSGYSVEFRIPFSQLRYDPTRSVAWQIQFQRNTAATGEQAYWAPILPESDGYVSRFGTLDGLDGLSAPRRIELVPYTSSRLTRSDGEADDPFYAANAVRLNAGLDARIGLTSGLTLTATVNPDFGQVEADPAVLNLSQFEVFYDERRPFFVEAQDIFAFGSLPPYVTTGERPDFFYSRRIGGAPSSFGALYADTTYAFLNTPEQTTIAGAAKLSGQVAGWTVGLLDAVTTDETARYFTESGERRTLPVAPLANYLVGRARRSWRDGRTLAGGFVSNVIRDTQEPAFAALLPSTATVGGIDVEVSSPQRAWTFSGTGAASLVRGEASVIESLQRAPQRYYQRPDADYLDVDTSATSLAGYRAELALAKVGGGRHWRGALSLGATSPGFEVNDLGFQTRADFLTADLYVLYNEPSPGPSWLRFARAFGYVNKGYSYGGDRVYDRYTAAGALTFSNLWTAQFTASARPEHLNDRLTRGGPLALRPSDFSLSGTIRTNAARRLSGGLRLSARREFPHSHQAVGNEWTRVVAPSLAFRPTDALAVEFEPSYQGAFNTDQYLGTRSAPGFGIDGRRYLFADTRVESLGLSLRTDWAFTPNLTLQLVAVPQVDAVRFSGIRELAAPRTYDWVRYGETRGSATPYVAGPDGDELPPAEGQAPDGYRIDPGDGGDSFFVANNDFTRLSLRGNAVLRWQWRPGSALFFVWQQVRDEYGPLGGLDIVSDIPDVFSADVQNVFLVKATYWFGL